MNFWQSLTEFEIKAYLSSNANAIQNAQSSFPNRLHFHHLLLVFFTLKEMAKSKVTSACIISAAGVVRAKVTNSFNAIDFKKKRSQL